MGSPRLPLRTALLKALPEPWRRVRGEQRVPEAGPELRQGRAGHGSPTARRRAGKGGQLGGHLPPRPLFSFSAKKEQRCPLGSGQSLPSQPSSHLLQSPEDEPSQARQAPRPTRQPRRVGRRRGWPGQARPEATSAQPAAAGRALTEPEPIALRGGRRGALWLGGSGTARHLTGRFERRAAVGVARDGRGLLLW